MISELLSKIQECSGVRRGSEKQLGQAKYPAGEDS